MSTKKQRMYERIEKHGQTIVNYFGMDIEPVALCKKLRRLEIKSNLVMVDYCNGDIDSDGVEDYTLKDLRPKLEKIFGQGISSIYINHDPRGYTLKLNEIESKRVNGYKDWGGYFILAPDFSGA